jgi:hypothetical protein
MDDGDPADEEIDGLESGGAEGRLALAVLCAAGDAVRVGHQAPLPLRLLTAAAPAYLAEPERGDATPESIALALTSGPLSRFGRYAGETFTLDARVADALTRRSRASLPAPHLWEALVAHTAAADDRVRIAEEAERRSLFRYVVELCSAPATAGHPRALMVLGRLFTHRLDNRQAGEACLQRAAAAGDGEALFAWGQHLQSTRRRDEGTDFIRRAAETGLPMAMANWSGELARAGKLAEADVWAERVASLGDPESMYLRGSELERAGDIARAEFWLTRAADAGESLAIVTLDTLLRGLDRAADADAQLRIRAEHIPYAMYLLARNHPDRAERKTLLERAAAAGETAAMKALAEEAPASRRSDEAEAWLQRAIQAGDTWALATLLKWHEDEIERGERIEYFLESAATCRADELWELAERFDDAGLGERVDAHFRRAAEQGDTLAQAAYAQRLWRTERREEAESWWRRALENGAGFAIDGLEDALKEVRRSKEAKALRRFGIEPGGRTGKFDVDPRLLGFLGVG